MAIIACIQFSKIINTIIGDTEYALSLDGIDTAVDITNIVPQPGINWTYNAGVFTPPPQ